MKGRGERGREKGGGKLRGEGGCVHGKDVYIVLIIYNKNLPAKTNT